MDARNYICDIDTLKTLETDMPERTVKSAERTLALFELFSERQAGLTVGQIAEGLHAPQPSISMLVKSLANLGYLEHDRTTRLYTPSIRVVLLGSWIERRFKETQSLVKRLDAIQRRVKETSYIAIQNRVYAQYVMEQRSAKPAQLDIFSGNVVHLTQSACGRALLALKPDSEVAALIKRCNAEVDDDRFKIKRNDSLRMISDIRKKGYAKTANASTRVQGIGAIAMTFQLPGSSTALAVGVGATIGNLERKHAMILDSLREFKMAFSD